MLRDNDISNKTQETCLYLPSGHETPHDLMFEKLLVMDYPDSTTKLSISSGLQCNYLFPALTAQENYLREFVTFVLWFFVCLFLTIPMLDPQHQRFELVQGGGQALVFFFKVPSVI